MRSHRLNVGAALVVIALSDPALAQSQATAPANGQTAANTTNVAAPASQQSPEVGEIIVTAQRRAESVQRVPLAVTVVTGADLAARHFSDPAQLQFVAPNLEFTGYAATVGATNFAVRGIGTQSFSNLIEPSVATVIDGVVMGRPEMGVMQFSDLDRVEVLAGPQGMLFGKNASAGLINIVTRAPRIGLYEFDAHAEAGVVNDASKCCSYLDQATVNIPVSSTAALRLNGFYLNYGGVVKDVVKVRGSDYGQDEYGLRGKFLWEPNERLKFTLGGDYAHSVGMGSGAVTERTTVPLSRLYPDEVQYGIVASPDNLLRDANAVTNVHFRVGGVQNEVSYKLDDAGTTLTNILAYRFYKGDVIQDADVHHISYVDYLENFSDFKQLTEELRLASASGKPLEYQAGLFYYDGKSDFHAAAAGNLLIGPPPAGYTAWAGFHPIDNLNSKSYAAYGQATVHLNDQLRVTAGGRYTADRLSNYSYNDKIGFVYGFGPDANEHRKARANNFSWRGSIQYDVAPGTMAYATVSRGYKGPGFNFGYTGGGPVGPEHSTAYEVGLKSKLAPSLILNVDAYWENITDLQTQAFVASIPAYVITNAGGLRARGFEAQLHYAATRNLTLSANGAFNDAIYTNFTNALCYAGQTAAQGCVGGVTDATGNPLLNAPKWTGTIALDYKRSLNDRLQGDFHVDAYGRSAVNFSANGDPGTRQGGYALLNANLGVGPESGSWRASLFCRNCLDRRFVTFIQSNPDGIAGDYYQAFGLTSFRTIGLSLDLKI